MRRVPLRPKAMSGWRQSCPSSLSEILKVLTYCGVTMTNSEGGDAEWWKTMIVCGGTSDLASNSHTKGSMKTGFCSSEIT